MRSHELFHFNEIYYGKKSKQNMGWSHAVAFGSTTEKRNKEWASLRHTEIFQIFQCLLEKPQYEILATKNDRKLEKLL